MPLALDAQARTIPLSVVALVAIAASTVCAAPIGARSSRIVLGKHSGTAAVRYVLAAHGVAVTPDETLELLAAIRARAATNRKKEFIKIAIQL